MADLNMRITIDGLPELRQAVHIALGRAPRELTVALKKGGEPLIEEAGRRMIPHPRRIAADLRALVSGTKGDLVSSIPFAGGAEWGQRGKWAGWVKRYGPPPRFVWPAVEERADEAMEVIARELAEVLTVLGWFRGRI
jgi:hypothetical protein